MFSLRSLLTTKLSSSCYSRGFSTATAAAVAAPPFHLAFPTHDLEASRHFYGTILGCEEGRSSKDWIDFNLYGHQ
eukprot:Pgem_evm1s12923